MAIDSKMGRNDDTLFHFNSNSSQGNFAIITPTVHHSPHFLQFAAYISRVSFNMVGTTIIGDNSQGAHALPPEARTINRYFRLLDDPNTMKAAFYHALEDAPPDLVKQVKESFEAVFVSGKRMESRKDKLFEKLLAKGIYNTVEHAFEVAATDDDDSSMASPRNSDDSLGSPKRKKTLHEAAPKTATSLEDGASAALISEDGETQVGLVAPPMTMTSDAFWTMILEAMHLEVVSRTNRIWGRQKIYEVYRLNGVATSTKTPREIRDAIQEEFSSAFRGKGCRTYALLQDDGYLYIHLVIGKPYDFHDERNRSISGEKKKKAGNEFVVMVKPGSSLMAISASRAPSRSRFLKFALTSFDFALSVATVTKNGKCLK